MKHTIPLHYDLTGIKNRGFKETDFIIKGQLTVDVPEVDGDFVLLRKGKDLNSFKIAKNGDDVFGTTLYAHDGQIYAPVSQTFRLDLDSNETKYNPKKADLKPYVSADDIKTVSSEKRDEAIQKTMQSVWRLISHQGKLYTVYPVMFPKVDNTGWVRYIEKDTGKIRTHSLGVNDLNDSDLTGERAKFSEGEAIIRTSETEGGHSLLHNLISTGRNTQFSINSMIPGFWNSVLKAVVNPDFMEHFQFYQSLLPESREVYLDILTLNVMTAPFIKFFSKNANELAIGAYGQDIIKEIVNLMGAKNMPALIDNNGDTINLIKLKSYDYTRMPGLLDGLRDAKKTFESNGMRM